MVFVIKDFSNGDTLPEADLDNLVANDVHVRAEAEYKHIGSIGHLKSDPDDYGIATAQCVIKIDTTTIDTWSGTGNQKTQDEDISSFSDGLHTLVFEFSYGAYSQTVTFRFVKTADMDYMTLWGVLEESGTSGAYVFTAHSVSAIGHSSAETW